jgi:hypothetical protein
MDAASSSEMSVEEKESVLRINAKIRHGTALQMGRRECYEMGNVR